MKLLKILLLTIMILGAITGCCLTDHSKIIKEVAEPMLKQLKHFYAKNKRFPNVQERNEMLEKVGCRMDGDFCGHKKKSINISSASGYDYSMAFNKERTFCYIYLNPDGSVKEPSCHNEACRSLKQ